MRKYNMREINVVLNMKIEYDVGRKRPKKRWIRCVKNDDKESRAGR